MIPNTNYSVRVKNGSGWRKFSRVRLMISVGQEYHENLKFKAVVDWLNRNSEIQDVHISVNDFLQRHNYYALGFDHKQADAIARVEGTHWLERNEEFISEIQARTLVTRWQDWYQGQDYQSVYKGILELQETNETFAQMIRQDAEVNTARKLKRGEKVPDNHVEHSMNYLREELAVFTLQSKDIPSAEVYPGSNLLSAEYLLNKALPDPLVPLATRYFTRIDFARVKTSIRLPSVSAA